MKKATLNIATRKSKLALWQANFIKSALEKQHAHLTIELVEIVTDGDREQNSALTDVGGKSNFVKALQAALLNHEADIAVHSMKDMSAHDTPYLTLGAIAQRADARDAFVSNHYVNIDALPSNAIVGTASPRRACILKSLRPDVEIKLLRGNVDTRLQKLDRGEYDAIILAAAGLIRLNLENRIQSYLDETVFTPAIAQGAIGIECREEDDFIRDLLWFLNDSDTAVCVSAERRVNQILNGDCHTAIGAYATLKNNQLTLSVMIGNTDGTLIVRAEKSDIAENYLETAESVANDLIAQGAKSLMSQ